MYNTEKFIEKSKKTHNNKYNYSLVDYTNSKTKVKIICEEHGIFEQTPVNHIKGRGCPICGGSNKKNNDIFISDAIKKHGNIYDYSLVEYKTAKDKVEIICKKHGIFEQQAYNHINGSGCQQCYLESKNKTTEQFISDSIKKHGGFYDYSKVKYEKNNIPVEIICNIHGPFFQQPSVHLNGGKCPICADENKKLTKIQFIINSIKKHSDFYDYSKSIYINNYTKLEIICPIHGSFYQTPNFHMLGQGCPSCKKSIMEEKIARILENNNIIFIRQKKFENCKNKIMLSFDFYLPNYNICIEYNGKQHYEPIDWFGGIKTLEYIKNNDNIKKNYCKTNNIKFLEISYKDNDLIEEIIKKELNLS
jgi:hypothetical protein